MTVNKAEFFLPLSQDVITFVPIPPPSPLLPVEHPNSCYFTVAQLQSLHQQLQLSAPSGFIRTQALVDTLQGLVRSSSKDGSLPLIWRDATKQQVCINIVYVCEEYHV